MALSSIQVKLLWHTYFSFLAGDNFHEHADVFTRPVGNQMNEDKSGAQENRQRALNDKTTFNDGVISSSNSNFVHLNLFRFTNSYLFLFLGISFL